MKFKRGKSGNPKGRPKGRPDRRTALRELLQPHAQELIQKAVDLALEGDGQALRLCLERLVPPIRSTDEPVVLDGLTGSLTEKAEKIVAAMAAGTLTPSQATDALQSLSAHARIKEVDDLERRVSELEQARQASGGKS